MQIKNKFIQDNAVDDRKVRLRNGQYLRARNAADTADVDILRVNSSNASELAQSLSAAGFKVTNLADPTSPQDAATKNYVDLAVQGLAPKEDVALATTSALPSCTYSNGSSGVGATLTGSANGALGSVDGVSAAQNDRILVKDQANQIQNGIYVVTQIGDASNPFILTRAVDADTPTKLLGAYTISRKGTVNGDHFFICTAEVSAIGTDNITFADYGSFVVSAGNGISKTGATLSTNNGPGLGYSGPANAVLVDQTTTKINGSNQVAGLRANKETFTLGSVDISNQYVDLAQVAHQNSIRVTPVGGPTQAEGSDYTLNYTGGANSKTRISFTGDLATGGSAALVAGDILIVEYQYL
jgi:hypothetical protein